jgi:hypothetical protein
MVPMLYNFLSTRIVAFMLIKSNKFEIINGTVRLIQAMLSYKISMRLFVSYYYKVLKLNHRFFPYYFLFSLLLKVGYLFWRFVVNVFVFAVSSFVV